jgi:hypothetical protein
MNLSDITPIDTLTVDHIRDWETQGFVFYPIFDTLASIITPVYNEKYNSNVITVKVVTWYNILLSFGELGGIEITEILGSPTVSEKYPNAFEQLKGTSYVAVLPGIDFTDHTSNVDNLELYTDKPQKIAKIYKIVDGMTLLKDLGVNLQDNPLQ